ncbi:MAG: serpin family protein [Thermodesulfobacteriota bacterium]|nr:serpin family protein [Thermodesulfobacteriota bacterium]
MRPTLGRLATLWVLMLLSVSLVSCNGNGGDSGASSQTVQGAFIASERERSMVPATSPWDVDELVEGNTDFAFDLYQALRDEDDNVIYSPYSISLALAMTFGGARHQTEMQMAETLNFTLGQEGVHPAFNALDLELERRGKGAQGSDGKGFRLHVANAIWGQAGYSFLSDFLDTLAENYGAGLRLLDFAAVPEESRLTINDWVSDETEERIPDLLPPGSVTSLTRLVLTNAIYFNAAWNFPFDELGTQPGLFHLLGGGEVTADMMSQVEHFNYFRGSYYQVIELPYDGHELSMVIFIPDEGWFEAFENVLTADKVDEMVKGLSPENVSLTMPKFTFDFGLSLNQILAAMGMPDAFDPTAADFSGMDGSRSLFISNVLHKAFIAVDEEGTEAAAATAVVMELTAVLDPPIVVSIDRPFVFMIRDLETRTVLFMGRVLHPET